MLNEDAQEIGHLFKITIEKQEKDDNWDKYAARLADTFITSGNRFGPIFTNLIKIDNLVQSGKYDTALEVANTIKEDCINFKGGHKDPTALWYKFFLFLLFWDSGVHFDFINKVLLHWKGSQGTRKAEGGQGTL